jgi:hypothetical protein
MREMMAEWNCLAIGRMAGCRTPSIRVLHVHRIVLRLDVDVARAPLQRGVDRGIHQADDRADVARQPLDGQVVFAGFIVFEELNLEAFGRRLEHALRALALLQHRLDGRPRADGDLDRRPKQCRQLVDHRQVAWIGHDDHERLVFTAGRHKTVPQHQVRGNRPEQLRVDPELRHVDELDPIALREPSRVGLFGGMVDDGDVVRYFRPPGFHQCTTDDSWNSGRYSASSRLAMTSPRMMRSTGSIRVTNRSRLDCSSSS